MSQEGGFSWIKSSTKCGLRTGKVDTRVAGNWKCHLGKIALLIQLFESRSMILLFLTIINSAYLFINYLNAILSGHFKYCSL